MDSKKLKKRKRQADKRMRIFEELNRPVTYILDDVKETIVTENTYKAIPYDVLKTYFLPKGWFYRTNFVLIVKLYNNRPELLPDSNEYKY